MAMGNLLGCGSRSGFGVILGCGLIFLAAPAFGGDTVFLKEKPEGNRGVVIEETDEHVVIRFPRSEIRLIRREALPNRGREVRSPEGHLAPAREKMPDQQGQDRTAMQLEKEATRFGAVYGQILYRGKGLAGCKVKLIRQLESTTFLGLFKEARAGAEFDAVSGEDGMYRFEQLPAGKYLLRWLPPGSDAWIIRLSDRKYDVLVEERTTVRIRDIDVSRPVLDR
jgi:hypothetical protein